MATSAFGGLGMQNLGAENVTAGPGMDLGRALLGMGISKSGLEGWMNENLGVGIKNGQFGAYTPSTGAVTPAGAVAPTGSFSGAQFPAATSMNSASPMTSFSGSQFPANNAEGKAMLNNVVHTEPSPINQANNQQAFASNAAMPPPSPIMGGVVPPTNEYMNGPGLRDKIAKYAMAAFA